MAWLYVFRSIKPIFQSIESCIERLLFIYLFFFLKKLSFSRVLRYSNFFQSSFSLSLIGPRVKARFFSFSTKFLQGFLSSKANKTFIPLLFLLFSIFMHFCHAFGVIFKPKGNWVFWWFKLFLWKLFNGFLLWDNIKLFLIN